MAHSDKVEHPSSNTVEDLLPGLNNERVNIDEVENSTRSLISTCLQWRMGWGGRVGLPWVAMEKALFSIFRIPPFLRLKSQKKINLTLKQQQLRLFVKDVRRRLSDDANSSKPTCSWHAASLRLASVSLVTGGQTGGLTTRAQTGRSSTFSSGLFTW